MPLGPGVRFRFKTVNHEEALRLAFKNNKVIEVVPFHKVNGVYKKGKR